MIHGVVWKNQVDKFKNLLHEGSIYILKNFKVVPASAQYRPVTNKYRIIFLLITSVKRIEVPITIIPKNAFQFADFDLINERINENTILIGTYNNTYILS